VPARYAAYSANLAILVALPTGQVNSASLFPASPDPVWEWRKLALLWRSQLPADGWEGLVNAVKLDRVWLNDDQRDVILRYDDGTVQPRGSLDLFWSYGVSASDEYRQSGRPYGWRHNRDNWLRAQAWFLCDEDDDTTSHALDPFMGDLDVLSSFHSYWPAHDRTVSVASALIALWLASGSDLSPADLAGAYDTCLEIVIRARFGPGANALRKRVRTLVLRQLAADQHRVPRAWLISVIARIRLAPDNTSGEVSEASELVEIASDILPELVPPGLADPTDSLLGG
jgi:hypothetical protein